MAPIKQTSCKSDNSSGRALSTYSRENKEGEVKMMFKRMINYDINNLVYP